jgi:restriction endonuclease S subunit
MAAYKKESAKSEKRLNEIDTLIQKLYEDKVFGVITQERFMSMSAKLEEEQKSLKSRFAELTEYLDSSVENARNAELFADLVRQYTDITELDSELVHTLIEKIVVHETEVVNGEKVKRVDIFYRFIGNVGVQGELAQAA